jgi:hypothetical protein
MGLYINVSFNFHQKYSLSPVMFPHCSRHYNHTYIRLRVPASIRKNLPLSICCPILWLCFCLGKALRQKQKGRECQISRPWKSQLTNCVHKFCRFILMTQTSEVSY